MNNTIPKRNQNGQKCALSIDAEVGGETEGKNYSHSLLIKIEFV